jgi:hypothetical protein
MKKLKLKEVSGGLNLNTNGVNINTPTLGLIDKHTEVVNNTTQKLNILDFQKDIYTNYYGVDSKGDYALSWEIK